MPARNINSSYSNSINDLNVLRQYLNDLNNLSEVKFQYMVGEIIMLRIFSVLESSFSEIALKLACGAKYRNGNHPVCHLICSSISDAHSQMLSLGRRRPKRYLQWTTEAYIEDSIKFVLNLTDKYFLKIQTYAAAIDEMRIVRNHIAHKTSSTKTAYINVLRTRYGANPNLSVGAFLTSTSRNATPNLVRYLTTATVILDEITAG